jgi:uncharacterized membrane protein
VTDLISWFQADLFLWAKWGHVVCSTVLFGTGLGTALHMWLAHRSGNVQAIATVARNVVFAEWMFTAPSGVIQPATGAALIWLGGYSPTESWLVVAYALYGVAAFCWFVVVWIQMRVRTIAREAMGHALPREYYAYMRAWFVLGWPAFLGLLGVFFLMVWRPALW